MPNFGGPKEKIRRLYVNVVHAVALYGSPLWADVAIYSARYHSRVELLLEGLEKNQLAEALAQSERQAQDQQRQQWVQLLDEPWVAVQRVVAGARPFVNQWLDSCTGRLTYRVTQVLTGHGCFGEYLHRISKEPTTHCHECGAANDTAQHTLEECPEWPEERRELVAKTGEPPSLGALLRALVSGEEDVGHAAVSFCETVVLRKEEAKRAREREPGREWTQQMNKIQTCRPRLWISSAYGFRTITADNGPLVRPMFLQSLGDMK
ncbi:uncharacterized protein LOC109861458 [Pseudomyrmex gracilis]|uniref:uncharacterized protein LOC109861458 n=1 Tax=Pseudomyrmex gracilis TaxID=219809 RepID=UPI000995C58E|nr:uncharacterized protein LOC109861458 [Pseudomyrmex gracilis]